MRRWLVEMKPKELKHVIAMVALFRPGPMDFIPGYIKRMHGEEPVEYRHPWLEEIFKETYGYPVYQEQLMFAAMKLAGYTAPEADDLRKAIAKKMRDKLDAHRQKFIDGSVGTASPPRRRRLSSMIGKSLPVTALTKSTRWIMASSPSRRLTSSCITPLST